MDGAGGGEVGGDDLEAEGFGERAEVTTSDAVLESGMAGDASHPTGVCCANSHGDASHPTGVCCANSHGDGSHPTGVCCANSHGDASHPIGVFRGNSRVSGQEDDLEGRRVRGSHAVCELTAGPVAGYAATRAGLVGEIAVEEEPVRGEVVEGVDGCEDAQGGVESRRNGGDALDIEIADGLDAEGVVVEELAVGMGEGANVVRDLVPGLGDVGVGVVGGGERAGVIDLAVGCGVGVGGNVAPAAGVDMVIADALDGLEASVVLSARPVCVVEDCCPDTAGGSLSGQVVLDELGQAVCADIDHDGYLQGIVLAVSGCVVTDNCCSRGISGIIGATESGGGCVASLGHTAKDG